MKKILVFMLALIGFTSVAFAYDDYGADLVVKDITYSQANKKIDIQVSNIGTVDVTRAFRIRLEVDGQSYYFRVNERINANRTTDFYVDISKFDVTKNQMLVLGEVDVDGVISEVNKTNNKYVGYIYLYPQDKYSDRKSYDDYYDDTVNNSNNDNYYDNNNSTYPCCDRYNDRYNQDDCDKYNNDYYNGNYKYYNGSDSISISEVTYLENDDELRIKIANNSNNQRATNLKIRVDMNGYVRYYTVNNTINKKSYVYFTANIDDFNVSKGSSYFVRVQIVGNTNSLSKTISISDNSNGTNGVDLRATDITYDKDSQRINVKIQNYGGYDSNGNFRIKMDINGYVRYYQVNSTIRRNGYIWTSAYLDDFNITTSRYYSIAVTVDPDNSIYESNENNNTFSQSIYLYELLSRVSYY